jgi:hypothetical protein
MGWWVGSINGSCKARCCIGEDGGKPPESPEQDNEHNNPGAKNDTIAKSLLNIKTLQTKIPSLFVTKTTRSIKPKIR